VCVVCSYDVLDEIVGHFRPHLIYILYFALMIRSQYLLN